MSDHSGKNNHGVISGARLSEDMHGQVGKAYSFDGSNDYIRANLSTPLTGQKISISTWVKVQPNASATSFSFPYIIHAAGGTNDRTFSLGMESDWVEVWGAGRALYYSNSRRLPVNKWTMLTASMNEDALNFYINGQINETTSAGTTSPLNLSSFSIGYRNGGNFFKGSIDEVRIYERSLSSSEVLTIYNLESTAPTQTTPIYIPIVQTLPAQSSVNGAYKLGGKILFDGGATASEAGVVLSENIFLRNPIRIPSKEDLSTSNFSISYNDLLPGKTYYFKAYAINSAGENRGSVKKFKTAPKSDSTSWYKDAESLPAGWRKSAWLGAFRPSNHHWIYHSELGWLYPSPMPDGSLWLWNEKDGWRWTQQGVFPYLFRWRDSSWVYFQGKFNGRIIFYNYTTKSLE